MRGDAGTTREGKRTDEPMRDHWIVARHARKRARVVPGCEKSFLQFGGRGLLTRALLRSGDRQRITCRSSKKYPTSTTICQVVVMMMHCALLQRERANERGG